MIARVYMYAGSWVADCPRGCGNTELVFESSSVQLKKAEYNCSYCRASTQRFEWPENMEEIEKVLLLRPIPYNRNWYPKDHEVAVRFRIPHGQSVDDLREENKEHDLPTG